MYLSKSIYLLFEQAEDLEALAVTNGVSSGEVLALSRELGARSRKLAELAEEREKAMREIRAALKAGKPETARIEMQQFKKREAKILFQIGGLERKAEKKEFAKLSREEQATKKALENYFLKQAPRILKAKREIKKSKKR